MYEVFMNCLWAFLAGSAAMSMFLIALSARQLVRQKAHELELLEYIECDMTCITGLLDSAMRDCNAAEVTGDE